MKYIFCASAAVAALAAFADVGLAGSGRDSRPRLRRPKLSAETVRRYFGLKK